MLSKVTSDILVELEMANSLLEDALLTEIHGNGDSQQEKYYMEGAIEHLIATDNRLGKAIDCIDHLLAKMERLNFQDTAELDQMIELENAFLAQRIIPERCSAWKGAITTIEEGGFRKIFYQFHSSLEEIKEDLGVLIEVFYECQKYATEGSLLQAIESNEIPLRQNFVRVYVAYLNFSATFACSSIISTELYLKTQGYPSLAESLISSKEKLLKASSGIY
ncbi:hypothetical protein KAT95_02590 [Candidatus Parcubacteria bacterium]|nr:hypothetical protein [Candidatus Parcubacteria bacterium]